MSIFVYTQYLSNNNEVFKFLKEFGHHNQPKATKV